MQNVLTPPVIDAHTQTLIRLAVEEDLGTGASRGDKTVELAIPAAQQSTANIVARKPGVLSGTYLLPTILQHYHPDLRATVVTADGSELTVNQTVATITGPTRPLLSAERVVLNFLSHLSGIATMTRRYVNAVSHVAKPPLITDTRKTTPGYRAMDKYAVRCGGGVNHRIGLYDGVMLKDNHLAALRNQLGQNLTLAQLTAHIRQTLDSSITLWLEVDTIEQLKGALPGGGADIILLDNFEPAQLCEAVKLRDAVGGPKRVMLESSGGVTLENLPQIAETGIDSIAIGAITHSAPILDLSMEFT